jgi:hypothetical protein
MKAYLFARVLGITATEVSCRTSRSIGWLPSEKVSTVMIFAIIAYSGSKCCIGDRATSFGVEVILLAHSTAY